MKTFSQNAARLAVAIHEMLQQQQMPQQRIELPTASWNELQKLRRQIERAEQRRWRAAACRLRGRLANLLGGMQSLLGDCLLQLDRSLPRRPLPSEGAIYRDIVALEAEFDEVRIDLRGGRLSVVTEPITLEGVYLGPFRVALDWHEIGEPQPFEVIAEDPHPAASSEEVTHPHVESGKLCEGEAHPSLRRALRAGRLLDFFCVVAQTLRTYNSSSPYVPLEKWHGLDCRDCAGSVDEEDSWRCAECEGVLCDDCRILCESCSDAVCSGCSQECFACQIHSCNHCTRVCRGCQKDFCTDCFAEEHGRCQDCHQRTQTTQQENQDAKTPEPTAAAVHPHRLGQAAVSA